MCSASLSHTARLLLPSINFSSLMWHLVSLSQNSYVYKGVYIYMYTQNPVPSDKKSRQLQPAEETDSDVFFGREITVPPEHTPKLKPWLLWLFCSFCQREFTTLHVMNGLAERSSLCVCDRTNDQMYLHVIFMCIEALLYLSVPDILRQFWLVISYSATRGEAISMFETFQWVFSILDPFSSGNFVI